MAQEKLSQKRWQGIADYTKETAAGQIPDSAYFLTAINYRDDPQALTLLPGALKESGSVVTDFLKWADIVPTTLDVYLHGDSGNVYKRTTAGSWSNLFTVPSSHGNGLGYFTGDDYLYLTGDSNISRYGPISNSPQFTANFLTAQGGIPQNTASLVLVSASSQYGSAPDSASLSITGDLTLEAYFKATTLPSTGNSMTLIGKWDESGALRSYKLDLYGVSGYFGAGTDGSLTISVNTTDSPIDSACTGTAGTQTLTATNASFAVGQIILIHQSQGTNAGQYERNTIQGYTAGTITLQTPLKNTYTTGAQVIVVKQYTNVTVNAGVTWTAKSWNGITGGILTFLANGTVTVNGTITAYGAGFRNGTQSNAQSPSISGEGTLGIYTYTASAYGNAGSGVSGSYGAPGGGNGTAGSLGPSGQGVAGAKSSANDLSTMTFGGAGGHGGEYNSARFGANGHNGGGILYISAVSITGTGTLNANGIDGESPFQYTVNQDGAGGGGAGGCILLKAQTITLSGATVTATGGAAAPGNTSQQTSGAGGAGVVVFDYLTSYAGTSTPTVNPVQDNTLVTTTTIQARLGISNDGTAVEYLTQNLNTLTTGVWNRLSVTWQASISTATFYLNAVSLGTSVGTKTSIHDNTSLLYIGANKGASTVGNFFNGKINDFRIINNVQASWQISNNLNIQISTNYVGLQAYYKFNSASTDATSNGNNLTLSGAPSYDTADVPFAAPTTRLDIDASQNLTGQLYTLPTAISEASTDKLPFIPVNDPQNSVGFFVNTKGTGDWTVTVHDQQNRVIASKTITNANIPASGEVEFIFSTPWRIVSGESYHMHVTVSTGTSKIVSGTISDLSTAEFTTYFGFLVPDTNFHPITQFQYQPLGGTLTGAEIIGNERYIAVWDGANYLPNFITLTPGWHIRCFAQWRQYLAIGVWRGSNIYDFHQGRIYFWSGYQPAYDFFIDVPEGQINALFGVDSDLYIFAGWRGILLDYKGGYFYNTGNTISNKLKRMPLLESSAYTEVFPGALNMWRGMLHFGLYANSNSTTSKKGVYSFGTLNQYYPDTLSYDYYISTGNQGSSVQIGLVYPVGENLIIGWKDGTAYGADVVNFSNNPAPWGEVQTLIFDNGNIWKNERVYKIRADFLPLNSGESIQTEFNIDRNGWTVNSAANIETVYDSVYQSQPIMPGQSREIQLGAKLYATGTTSPTLLGLSLLYDDTKEENAF